MAPEMYLDHKYTKAVDYSAAGVTVFGALSSKSPWNTNTPAQRQQAIVSCEVTWIQEIWEEISQEARNFVEALIQRDPDQRLTPDKALIHPWLV